MRFLIVMSLTVLGLCGCVAGPNYVLDRSCLPFQDLTVKVLFASNGCVTGVDNRYLQACPGDTITWKSDTQHKFHVESRPLSRFFRRSEEKPKEDHEIKVRKNAPLTTYKYTIVANDVAGQCTPNLYDPKIIIDTARVAETTLLSNQIKVLFDEHGCLMAKHPNDHEHCVSVPHKQLSKGSATNLTLVSDSTATPLPKFAVVFDPTTVLTPASYVDQKVLQVPANAVAGEFKYSIVGKVQLDRCPLAHNTCDPKIIID